MRNLSFLLVAPLLLVSCIPEGSGTQGNAPDPTLPTKHSAPLSPVPTHPAAPQQYAPSLVEDRLKTQNDRIGRLETELHEMRLLFTNQLKRIEEVANRPVQQLPATAYQAGQQPQQVVIMPNNPVVTHRWDGLQPQYGSSHQARSYQVRNGDTLSQIAEAHGLPTSALIVANPGINPLRLQIAKQVTIPSAKQASQYVAQAQSRMRSYQVQGGDTLSEIAEVHGIGLSQLLSNNPGLDPKRLRIGKTLRVPPVSSGVRHTQPAGYASPPLQDIQRQPQSAPQSKLEPQYKSYPSSDPSPPQEQTHKMFIRMKQATTLGEVALRHNTDVGTLNRLNHTNLSSAARIPALGHLYVPTSAPKR